MRIFVYADPRYKESHLGFQYRRVLVFKCTPAFKHLCREVHIELFLPNKGIRDYLTVLDFYVSLYSNTPFIK